MAAVSWGDLTHAGAFLVGAALATAATLRVIRHLAVMFGGDRYRRRRPPDDDDARTDDDARKL